MYKYNFYILYYKLTNDSILRLNLGNTKWRESMLSLNFSATLPQGQIHNSLSPRHDFTQRHLFLRWSALEAIFLGEGSDVMESLPQEVARFLEVRGGDTHILYTNSSTP